MAPETQTGALSPGLQVDRWNAAKRIAFRFCFVYFGLFCLTTQILGGLFPFPLLHIPDLGALAPVRAAVSWTAAHVFGVQRELILRGGSGDKTFDWVLAFCELISAAVATAIWTFLDRKRANYGAIYRWFRLFLRFALASEMLLYGIDKAVPLQMPFPYLSRLIEPYGNFSPMGVLWAFVGASPAYEIFAGCAEILGGTLLIFPRTTMPGALVCLASLVQIFTLNMTYDVPVKLFSFHLLLLSLFLLAPDLRRLFRFLFLNRATEPSNAAPLFRSVRANRIALAAQAVFGLALIAGNAYGASTSWHIYGGARPKSPLYGIWNITQLGTGGHSSASADNQWRRVIFDSPTAMSVQRMDDSFLNFAVSIDTKHGTITFTGNGRPGPRGEFKYQRTADNRLTLSGDLDGQTTDIQAQLLDRSNFLLVKRGFHWVQEYPFNR